MLEYGLEDLVKCLTSAAQGGDRTEAGIHEEMPSKEVEEVKRERQSELVKDIRADPWRNRAVNGQRRDHLNVSFGRGRAALLIVPDPSHKSQA